MGPIHWLITDVEGTTTEIAFVHKVLFPYAIQELPTFIETHQNDDAVKQALQQVRDTAMAEDQSCTTLSDHLNILNQWIAADRKHPALKELQGLVWESGYLSGKLKGHIYSEVPQSLTQMREGGIKLGVYSSGSVLAQKLLFGHSVYGDLTPFFDAYFDTAVGGKKEPESYKAIAAQLQERPHDILFVSDVLAELEAANTAGFQCIQMVRPDNRDTATGGFPIVESFNGIVITEGIVENLLGTASLPGHGGP